MAYGIEIFNASGVKTLATTDSIARLHGTYSVPAISAGGSYTVTVSGMANDGNWIPIPQTEFAGMTYTITSGSFTINANYTVSPAGDWYVMRKDGTGSTSGYGFSVTNDIGGVQIDQAYQNFVKLGGGNGLASGTEVSLVSGATIYAVRPSASTSGTIKYASASSGKFAVTCNGTWDWVAYGPAGNASVSNHWGIRVYDAGGAVVFDDALSVVRPLDTITIPLSGSGGPFTIDAAPSGMRPFAVLFQLGFCGTALLGGGQGTWLVPKLTFTTNTSISSVIEQYGVGPPANLTWGTNRQINFLADF